MEKRMTDLRDSLAQVQELLGRATPGVLTCSDGPHGYQHRISDGFLGVCDVFASSDAAAIAAAVNFLRTHGPALLAMMEEMDGR